MAYLDKQTFLGGVAGPFVAGVGGGLGTEALFTTANLTINNTAAAATRQPAR